MKTFSIIAFMNQKTIVAHKNFYLHPVPGFLSLNFPQKCIICSQLEAFVQVKRASPYHQARPDIITAHFVPTS